MIEATLESGSTSRACSYTLYAFVVYCSASTPSLHSPGTRIDTWSAVSGLPNEIATFPSPPNARESYRCSRGTSGSPVTGSTFVAPSLSAAWAARALSSACWSPGSSSSRRARSSRDSRSVSSISRFASSRTAAGIPSAFPMISGWATSTAYRSSSVKEAHQSATAWGSAPDVGEPGRPSASAARSARPPVAARAFASVS